MSKSYFIFDKKAIQLLIKSGLCKEQIIKKIGCPSTSFYRYIKKENINIPKSSRYFNKEEEKMISEMFLGGKSIAEIQRITKRSVRVIRKAIDRHRNVQKQAPKKTIDNVVNLINLGYSQKEIAEKLNIKKSIVYGIARRRKLLEKINKKDVWPCESQKENIIDLIQQGKTQSEICSILNLKDNTLNTFLKRNRIIPNIYKYTGRSTPEYEIVEEIRQIVGKDVEIIHQYNIDKISIDIYIPKYNIGIEYNGLYWHSEMWKENNAHIKKYNECIKRGITLITVFEDEWKEKRDIITSIFKSKLNIQDRTIYARKCSIKEIDKDFSDAFFDENHLQGKPPNSILNVGLYFNDKIEGIISIGRHHRDRDLFILNRLAFSKNTRIVGGVSKMMKYIKIKLREHNVNKLITYSDNRWSNGNVYKVNGFKLESNIPHDYYYIKGKRRYSKQSLKKTVAERATGKTERELRRKQGFLRIWDCGKKKWVLDIY